jgi:RNA polymerase sigma-70 factor (ECF subfamily)
MGTMLRTRNPNVAPTEQNLERPASSDLPRLVADSVEGDTGAFRQIVERHQGYAFALAFRIVWDEDDARDVVQEAFIRVWRHLPGYDPAVRFTTWLYTIVTRLAYDSLKRQKRQGGRMADAGNAPVPWDPPDPGVLEEEISNRDLAAMVRTIAGELPLKQRMVFVLRDLEERTIEEIGEILAMSVGSVRTNLCYARREIRRRLQKMNV